MGAMASQITSRTIVYSTVYSGADQRRYQSSASLVFVWVIHRWPVNSPRKGPVTQKMFPFDDVIMNAIPYALHRKFSIMHIGACEQHGSYKKPTITEQGKCRCAVKEIVGIKLTFILHSLILELIERIAVIRVDPHVFFHRNIHWDTSKSSCM